MLKNTILVTTFALFVVLASQFNGSSATASSARLDDHEAIEKCMKAMKSEMRRLRQSVEDKAEKTKSLASIAVLQANIVTVKGLTPGVVKKSERKEVMAARYRSQMIDCLEQTIALERAVMADKIDEAKAALKALLELQDSGHADFKVEDH